MESFDYIIVGGGSAGATLAGRLQEQPGNTICVLEAGPSDTSKWIRFPPGFMKLIFDPNHTWGYMTEPNPAIQNRSIPMIQGRVIGGSGSINGMVYTRGQLADYDGWAQRGALGWSGADVLPYFRKNEFNQDATDDTYRGRDGKLATIALNWENTLVDAFIKSACTALDAKENPDYNGATQEGVGRYQYTIRNGRRVNAARAYLHTAIRHNTVDVRTGLRVTSIIFEGKRAVGIRWARWDGPQTGELRANKEVILCAGAINTPRLLQISGVGPTQLLKDIGVEVIHDLPGVGENLQDHYTPRFTYSAKNANSINDYARGTKLAGQLLRWAFNQPSLIGIGVVLGNAYLKSRPELEHPDYLITFTPGSMKEGFLGVLDDKPGVTLGAWQLRPDSRGYVRAASADPRVAPIIQPNYLKEDSDMAVLLTAMKNLRKVAAASPLADYCVDETLPGKTVATDQDLIDYARGRGLSGYHVCGSCRIGMAGDPMAVVDSDLLVHGMQGLRIVDASVMPVIPSGNTNAGTMMIAEKAADIILGRPALAA